MTDDVPTQQTQAVFKVSLSEGALQTIRGLCDIALKTGGLTNLQAVNSLMTEIGVSLAKSEAEKKMAAMAAAPTKVESET